MKNAILFNHAWELVAKALQVFIVGILWSMFSYAFAAEKIIAVTEEFPPYNYTENGKLTGYSVNIVEELLKRSTLDYQMASYPWARAYQMAQRIPNVLIFTIVRTPERESDFFWIGPVAQRKLYLFKLASRTDIRIDKLDDAKKYRLGVTRGDAAEDFLMANGFAANINIDLVPNEISNLRKLLVGRIDFMSGTELSVAYLCKLLGLEESQIERSILIVNQGEYFVAMSKQTAPEIVKKMQLTFSDMEKSKVIQEIAKKYHMSKLN